MLNLSGRIDDSASRSIKDVYERAQNLEPFWRSLTDWWDTRERSLFTGGRAGPSNATRLAALSPATIKRKHGNRTPLVRTGALRDAVLSGDPAKANDREAFFGIPKGDPQRIKAVFAVRGTARRPSRDPVPGLSLGERDDITDKLRRYLLGEES